MRAICDVRVESGAPRADEEDVEAPGFEYDDPSWRAGGQRIGKRQPVGVPVRWRVPRPLPTPRRSARSARTRPRRAPLPPPSIAAIAHDLSVSGARLLLPDDGSLETRKLMEIQVDGVWAYAWVVRLERSPDPAASWCGAMFINPSHSFILAVARTMEAGAARQRGAAAPGADDDDDALEPG